MGLAAALLLIALSAPASHVQDNNIVQNFFAFCGANKQYATARNAALSLGWAEHELPKVKQMVQWLQDEGIEFEGSSFSMKIEESALELVLVQTKEEFECILIDSEASKSVKVSTISKQLGTLPNLKVKNDGILNVRWRFGPDNRTEEIILASAAGTKGGNQLIWITMRSPK